MKIANLALRFFLELFAIAAVSNFAYHITVAGPARLALCIAAPVLFAILWGLFAAHKAKFAPPKPYKAIVGFLLLEAAALSVALAGNVVWAIVFAVVIAGNVAVLALLERQPG